MTIDKGAVSLEVGNKTTGEELFAEALIGLIAVINDVAEITTENEAASNAVKRAMCKEAMKYLMSVADDLTLFSKKDKEEITMIIRTCDRCGAVCKDDMKQSCLCKERNAVLPLKMQPYSPNEYWYNDEDIVNLCPSCMEMLQGWLHNGEFGVGSDQMKCFAN